MIGCKCNNNNKKQETTTNRKSRQAKDAIWHQNITEVETPDEKRCRVILNTASQQRSTEQNKNNKRKQPSPQQTELSQINNQHVISGDNDIKHEDVKRPEFEMKGSIKKAQTSAKYTHEGDDKHQALVCLVCNSLIIGKETIHPLSNKRLLMNQHRLSVKAYQYFNNGETLNPIIVQQHSVDDIPESLLSLMT